MPASILSPRLSIVSSRRRRERRRYILMRQDSDYDFHRGLKVICVPTQVVWDASGPEFAVYAVGKALKPLKLMQTP